jgi:hypothetical protein
MVSGEAYTGMCSVDFTDISGIVAVKPMARGVQGLRDPLAFRLCKGRERRC